MPEKSRKRASERAGAAQQTARGRFVVHEHHASRLHFDFRLEVDGVLKSWAVPKGPSLNPQEKRLAVAVPDHAVSYINFEGRISEGKYGAGEVRVWDKGEYSVTGDALAQLENGRLRFVLHGEKLQGEFSLIKMGKTEGQWLLIKSRDEFARSDWKLKIILKVKE